jgi:uncharacterized membrane protein YjdF
MRNHKNLLTALALALYAVFLALAWANNVFIYYAADTLFAVGMILFLHASFRFWRLSEFVYTLLILGFASHLMGIFGWYNESPIPLQWDHVTHGLPMFAFTAFFYNFARQWMGERFWSGKTWGALLLVLLAGLGVGALVENLEFAGYLTVGAGEGALFFGGQGDGVPLTSSQEELINNLGGGYINTEMDLVWNLFGALFAILVMSIVHFSVRKPALSRIG